MQAKGPFTHQLWQAIESIYSEVIHHQFVLGLANGDLPNSCFAHYLSQDVLYIKDDNKALTLVSERAINSGHKGFFKSLAKDGLAIEEALHDEFLEHFKIKEAQEKSPIIKAYTDFLLTHSEHSEYSIVVAALLPCFWLYYKVGAEIINKSKPNNPYQKWIDTYQGDEYEDFTSQFIQILEDLAEKADSKTLEKMKGAFVESARLELAFFEEAISF